MVAVEAAITVETIEFTCEMVGLEKCSLSVAMAFSASLSRTTTESAY